MLYYDKTTDVFTCLNHTSSLYGSSVTLDRLLDGMQKTIVGYNSVPMPVRLTMCYYVSIIDDVQFYWRFSYVHDCIIVFHDPYGAFASIDFDSDFMDNFNSKVMDFWSYDFDYVCSSFRVPFLTNASDAEV